MSPVHGAPPDDMSMPFLGHLAVRKNFGSSAVLGVLRGLVVEMIA
jgi:hypothetical protein